MVGKKFDRWTVLERRGNTDHDCHSLWLCRCDCGTTRLVRGSHLTRGKSKSCGCLRIEVTRKHGMSRTLLYRVWASMLGRCLNPSAQGYNSYGGRGIRVCDRWRQSFMAFYMDVGDRPSSKHWLDRMEVNGNYEPGNVRWATRLEGAKNCRVKRALESFSTEALTSELERRGFFGEQTVEITHATVQ